MADTAPRTPPRRGRAPAGAAPRRARSKPAWRTLAAGRGAAAAVHRVGPRGARAASSSRSCCRRRSTRSPTLVTGLAGGPLLARFRGHGEAHAAGVPDRRGHRRAARRRARQQRARVSQRRVPDRLLPLDAVVGADPAVPADLRRVGHQQGRDRRVRRVPDRRVQQRLRRDQRAQAARDGGAR